MANRSAEIFRACTPGLFSVRDAGLLMRGNALLFFPLAALGAGTSFAASPDLRGAFGAVLALLMLAIAISDAREFIIPDKFSAAAFVLGVAFSAAFGDGAVVEAVLMSLLRALMTAAPFFALLLIYEWWRGRPGLGLGDVKLAAVAGAWLDWLTIVAAVEVAALAALLGYGIWRFVLRRPIDNTSPLPFGLFLAPAIWAGWLGQTLFSAR
jgi:leader peptidase (prepilin peptidase) / N-methyltransferase